VDILVYILSCAQELQSDVADARLQAEAIHEAVHAHGEAAHLGINRVLQAVEQVRGLYSIEALST